MSAEDKPVGPNADVDAFLGRVRSFAEDPAVKPWREAMEQSTSARLRAVERERDNAYAELDRRLNEALMAKLAVERQLAEAHAENERLRTRLAQHYPSYHLTDQGRTAIARPGTEGPVSP